MRARSMMQMWCIGRNDRRIGECGPAWKTKLPVSAITQRARATPKPFVTCLQLACRYYCAVVQTRKVDPIETGAR